MPGFGRHGVQPSRGDRAAIPRSIATERDHPRRIRAVLGRRERRNRLQRLAALFEERLAHHMMTLMSSVRPLLGLTVV